MGSYGAHIVRVFWGRGGARNALGADAFRLDAERVLQIDPDVILLEGPWSKLPPAQFALDPRWSTLRAVREHRVYRQPRGLDGFMWNVIDNPLLSRWVAEVLHPDRVRPQLREMMRESYRSALGYSVTDAELDEALAMNENSGSAGYERFRAGYFAQGSTK
jgi:iron complex transport system substrate-binding protein